MFATLLVAIALGVLAFSITSWERLIHTSKERNGARLVARQEMERCLSLGFEELETGDTAGVPVDLEVIRTLDGTDVTSIYRTEITVATKPDGRVKSVDVTTSYGEAHELQLQLFTLVYQSS